MPDAAIPGDPHADVFLLIGSLRFHGWSFFCVREKCGAGGEHHRERDQSSEGFRFLDSRGKADTAGRTGDDGDHSPSRWRNMIFDSLICDPGKRAVAFWRQIAQKRAMHERNIEQIARWITEQALAGASETELLHGLCERANAAGLPVSSAITIIDTLHPIWEGRVFLWRNDGVEEEPIRDQASSMRMPKEISEANCRDRHQRCRLQVVAGVGDPGVRKIVNSDAIGGNR